MLEQEVHVLLSRRNTSINFLDITGFKITVNNSPLDCSVIMKTIHPICMKDKLTPKDI